MSTMRRSSKRFSSKALDLTVSTHTRGVALTRVVMGDEREKLLASEELERTVDRYTDGTATALEVVEAAERWRHSSVIPSEDVARLIERELNRYESGEYGTTSKAEFSSIVAAALRAVPPVETVNTVEELDALPVGTVVMEMTNEPFLGIPTVAGVFHKFPIAVQEPGREWFVVAGHGARPADDIILPARVLFRPDTEGSG